MHRRVYSNQAILVPPPHPTPSVFMNNIFLGRFILEKCGKSVSCEHHATRNEHHPERYETTLRFVCREQRTDIKWHVMGHVPQPTRLRQQTKAAHYNVNLTTVSLLITSMQVLLYLNLLQDVGTVFYLFILFFFTTGLMIRARI